MLFRAIACNRLNVIKGAGAFVWLTLICSTALAQTSVTGPITENSTWRLSGSPYTASKIEVVDGVTLTIEAGVEVRLVWVNSSFRVEEGGTLVVAGTEANPVVVTGVEDPGFGVGTRGGRILIRGTAEIRHAELSMLGYSRDSIYGNRSRDALSVSGSLRLQDSWIRDAARPDQAVRVYRTGTLDVERSVLGTEEAPHSIDARDTSGQANVAQSTIHGVLRLGPTGGAVSASTFPAEVGIDAPTGAVGGIADDNTFAGVVAVSGAIDADATLPRIGVPYRAREVRVSNGTILTVEAGVELQLDWFGSFLSVEQGGTLFSSGTARDPVTITGVDYGPADNLRTWGGPLLVAGTAAIEHTVIKHLGYEREFSRDVAREAVVVHGSLTLRDSELRDSGRPSRAIVVNGTGSLTVERSNIVNQAVISTSRTRSVATGNWWGHPSGPDVPDPNPNDNVPEGNPDGRGGRISGDVDYRPWATSPFTILPPAPDLVVTGLDLSPETAEPGQPLRIDFAVFNQGDAPAQPSTANVRLNQNPDGVTGDDLLLAQVAVPAIDPQTFPDLSATVTLPAELAPGSYHVWITADVNSTAGQRDETNDHASTPLTIEPGSGVFGRVVNVHRTGAGGVRRDGLEGATVRLYDGGTEVASTTSGPDGSYSFATSGTGSLSVGASFTVTRPDGSTLPGVTRTPATEGVSTQLDLPLGIAEEQFALTDRLSNLTLPAEFVLVGDVDVLLGTGYDVSAANALVEGWLASGDPSQDPQEVEAMLRLVLAEQVLIDLSHDAASAFTAVGKASFDIGKWVVVGGVTRDAVIRAANEAPISDAIRRKIVASAASVYRKFVFDRQWSGIDRIPQPYRDVALVAYDGMFSRVEGEAASTVDGTIDALTGDAIEDAAVIAFAGAFVALDYVPDTQDALDLAVTRASAFDMSGEYVYALNSLNGVGGLYSAVHDYVVANSARSAAVREEAGMNGSIADLGLLISASGVDIFGALGGISTILKTAQVAKLGIATYQGFEPLPDLYNLHPYAAVNSSFTAASGNRLAVTSTAPIGTPTALRGARDTPARAEVQTAARSPSSASLRGGGEAQSGYADALVALRGRLASGAGAEAEFSDLLDLDSALEAEIDVLEALARTALTDSAMAVLTGTVNGLHAARLGLLGSTTTTLIDPSPETFADAVAQADSVSLHLDLAYDALDAAQPPEPPAVPVLVLVSVSNPTSADPGASFDVAASVRNVGSGLAENVSLTLLPDSSFTLAGAPAQRLGDLAATADGSASWNLTVEADDDPTATARVTVSREGVEVARSSFSVALASGNATSDEPSAPVTTLRLGSPHPNPTRGAVSFDLSLPDPGHARVDLYDVLGRRVLTLVDETMPAGTVQVSFDGSALAPGSYVLHVTAGGEAATQHVTVTR